MAHNIRHGGMTAAERYLAMVEDGQTSEGARKAWETRRRNCAMGFPSAGMMKRLQEESRRCRKDGRKPENNDGFAPWEVTAFKTASPVMNHRRTLLDAINAGHGDPSRLGAMLSEVNGKIKGSGRDPDAFQAKYDKWISQNQ